MQSLRLGLLTLLPLCWSAPARGEEPPAPEQKLSAADHDFFEGQVRPLLIKHCYKCHSAEAAELKGGLALDTRSGWATGGDSGPAIVPGKPDDSLLITALRFEELEMPPQGKLPAAEIAVFEKWVQLGAPDPRVGNSAPLVDKKGLDRSQARAFWAFCLPEAHHPPAVKDTAWPKESLDHFILHKLEEQNLQPAADADPATWLRRVTFDLTGLPPTVAELDAFLADAAVDARETVVNRLLASPGFGVHWGRHWLDVARYADSNGSDFNATFFNAWRYRNYVVEAFQQDLPFNEFIREQIAGDLLPAATEAERSRRLIATTFLMVGPKMLSERDKDKLTMDVVDEQVDSVGKAFLGLTLGCARCHDHKFDPISTEEYYALAGIFHSTRFLEGESQEYVSDWVETPLPVPPEFAGQLQQHQAAKAELQTRLMSAQAQQKSAAAELAGLELVDEGILVDDTQATIVGQWAKSKHSPHFVGEGYLHDEKASKGEKSVTWTPELPAAGQYEVRVSYAGSTGRDVAVPYTIHHAAGETVVKVDQSKVPPFKQQFVSLGTFRFEAGKSGFVVLSTAETSAFVIADAAQFITREAKDAPEKAPVTADEKLVALKAQVKAAEELAKQLEKELKDWEAKVPKPPLAMAAREAPQIGDCQVCIRGEIRQRGKSVPRGFLEVVSQSNVRLQNKNESGRRELADWIARGDHPLTARVIVNRVWQHLLGEGIVRSVDNFGHLGERPSHPELLDTLAVQFVEDNWSVKHLVRRIALSRTYGLSTRRNSQAQLADPENRLLWRAHRKRLPAEALRDSLLQFSGQLELSPGGSPVAGLGRLVVDNTKQESKTSTKESFRRSLYLPIIRNNLPSFLTVFDFADPDLVTGSRPQTNVPAQALYLLNDPLVREQAKRIAERLLQEANTDESRIEAAFRLILSRPPQDLERSQTLQFLADVSATPGTQPLIAWSQTVQCLLASTEFRTLD